MAKEVVWTFPARADLRSHLEFLVQDSQRAASELFDEVEASAASLREFPERGRMVPELETPELRQMLVRKYRLIYRISSEEIIILRMIHGRQDFWSAWKR